MTAEPVLEWTHPDGACRVVIERVGEDRFRYVRFDLVEDEDFGSRYQYWRDAYPASGLYPSALDAQNDAASQMPWLGELLTKVAIGGAD